MIKLSRIVMVALAALSQAAMVAGTSMSATTEVTPMLHPVAAAYDIQWILSDQTSTGANARPKPKEKKKTTAKLIKSGARIQLTDSEAKRLQVRAPAVPRPATRPSATNSLLRTPPRDKKFAPFRLNIGICGRIGPDGSVPGPTRCQPFNPTMPKPNLPRTNPNVVRRPLPSDITWVQIYTQFADVLFPPMRAKVQPAGRTLVNLDTIVYTDESKVSVSNVTLLGFPIVVEAAPLSYSWNFGDGTPALTTTSPGAPYPSKEITHKYMKRGSAKVSVTTNYAARYNVADTGWQYVAGTVPITGPSTALLIREAVPVLVDPTR